MNYLNKRVIIVGPAEYLLKSNNKDFIDSFDIVIRIKSGYPVPKKYINNLGSKTNIIYSNLVPIRNNFTRNNLKEINKNNIIIKYPFPILKHCEYYDLDLNKHILDLYINFCNYYKKINYIKKKIYLKIFNKLKKRPSILILILEDILKDNPMELYITGFTFRLNWINNNNNYNNLNDKSYGDYYRDKQTIIQSFNGINKYSVHNLREEFKYIKELILKNNIKYDDEIKEILKIKDQRLKLYYLLYLYLDLNQKSLLINVNYH